MKVSHVSTEFQALFTTEQDHGLFSGDKIYVFETIYGGNYPLGIAGKHKVYLTIDKQRFMIAREEDRVGMWDKPFDSSMLPRWNPVDQKVEVFKANQFKKERASYLNRMANSMEYHLAEPVPPYIVFAEYLDKP